jgi:hypothetical protein
MCPGSVKGRVASVGQAREVLQTILSGDTAFIADIRQDQRDVAFHFSDAYCRPVWKDNLETSGLLANLAKQSPIKTISRELHRSAFRVIGRTLDNSEEYRPHQSAEAAKRMTGSSLVDGIAFNLTELPACVTDINGVSEAEPWGRWSDAERVVISLNHMLENEFLLDVTAIGYDRNAGADIMVQIGSASKIARFGADMDNPQTVSLSFRLRKPTNVIKFKVPYPTQPVKDSRLIGLGLVRLKMRPLAVVHDASQEVSSPLTTPGKMNECKTYIEAGILAAAVPATRTDTADTEPGAAPAVAPTASDRRPAWRRAVRVAMRGARPVLLPFSHRFRGHVRTAIEETAVLPQLSQVMAELTSLRHEIVNLRGILDTQVRQLQMEVKADRAAVDKIAAALSESLKAAEGIETTSTRHAKPVEMIVKVPERPPVDGT